MFSYTYLAYLAEENSQSPRLERPLNTECIMAKIFSCLHHDSDSLEGQATTFDHHGFVPCQTESAVTADTVKVKLQ